MHNETKDDTEAETLDNIWSDGLTRYRRKHHDLRVKQGITAKWGTSLFPYVLPETSTHDKVKDCVNRFFPFLSFLRHGFFCDE